MNALLVAGGIAGMVIVGQWAEKHDLNFFTALVGLAVLGLIGLCVLGMFGAKL